MKVTLLPFAGLRDAVGQERVEVDVADGADVSALWAALEEAFPTVERYRGRVAFAIDDRLVSAGETLREGAEVALLPPVSGG